jgi:ABC-type uncharacterized transport system permease subunit
VSDEERVNEDLEARDSERVEEGLPEATTMAGRFMEAASSPARKARNFALVLIAAVIASIPLFYIAGSNPAIGYRSLLEGSLGSKYAIAETFVNAIPLFLSGLAVALAFQGGLFNIGVEGQLLVGGLVAGALGTKLDLPPGIHLFVCIVGGMVAGALWALIPALLKARRGVHEVITTIMMNYIAFALSRFLVKPDGLLVSASQPSATDLVKPTAELPVILGGTRLHAGLWITILAGVATWYLLFRTPLGFRIRVVGRNPVAGRFQGMAPNRIIVQTMLLSGALGGLAGGVEVLGVFHRYYDAFSPGYGFDAIAVALLGSLNPIGVAVSAILFGILRAGSVALQAVAGVSRDMISVFSALVVAFAAAVPLVDRILDRRRRRRAESRRPAPPPEADREEVPVP